MKIVNKHSEQSLINQFVVNFEKYFLRKKKQNKRFSFVLTGGESPRRLYRKLAKSKLIGIMLICFGVMKDMFLVTQKTPIINWLFMNL